MNRLPLRRSLAWAILGLTTIALAVAGLTSVVALRAYLRERTDDQLRAAATFAQQRVGLLDEHDPRGATLRAVIAPTEYVVETRSAGGAVVRVAGPTDLPIGTFLAEAPAAPPDGRVSAATTMTSADYRAVSVDADGATVVVALSLTPARQTVQRLVAVELVAGAAVLLLLGVFARMLLARGLRPLDEITATAGAIAGGDLARRVAVDGPVNTEVGRLTAAVNGMLGRIQVALADLARSQVRLRHFAADASHELRTPLTSIRGYLQLLRQGMVAEADRPEVLRRADQEAARMASIVDDLLYLARLDAEPALRHDPVDLVAVVRDSLADALAVQPGRPAHLDVPESCRVLGDDDALRQVMGNLLANVRHHTPADASVTVVLSTVDGLATVAVSDSGPGVAPELARRAFDRFTRADASPGSGLGLAIVGEIVTAHGGTVAMDSQLGEGTTVTFTLPTADS